MQDSAQVPTTSGGPFRRAVLRGLAVVLPPLMTEVIFLCVGGTLNDYVLEPVISITRKVMARSMGDFKYGPHLVAEVELIKDRPYQRMGDDYYVPISVFELAKRQVGEEAASRMTSSAVYERYMEYRYLKPAVVVPVFILVFVLVMYLLGKFLAAGLGSFMWSLFEGIIQHVPVVRNVYSSVKQVTDFMISERSINFTRVVAIEYPRSGIWSLGFVTGESITQIGSIAQEPVVAVLVPTSPMPMTGFTVTIRQSEVHDLDMTIDQALQYLVSCGVVVPSDTLKTSAKRKTSLPAPDVGTGTATDGISTPSMDNS